MKRRMRCLCLVAAASCVSAAAPAPDWNALVRQGDAAYARGDYADAAALYDRAGDRATDPGLATFDLGAAKYRLALASEPDRARLAREAEQAFRCCTGPGDPRRPQALYGLGDALLLRSDGDAETLESAVAAYQECLREPALDAATADDARHNLERARLLLLQRKPSASRSQDEPPPGDGAQRPQPPDKTPGASQNQPHGSSGVKVKPDPHGDPAKAAQGAQPAETPDVTPGEGNLPPVPDAADAPPLSAEDAARHLEAAAQRILQDVKAHRRAKAPAPAPNVKDW